MSDTRQQKAAQKFRDLHTSTPGFIMPNAWDAGSAIVLANEGFKAIATTSAGIAFALGKADYNVHDARAAVSRDAMFDRMREIAAAVALPVNGDLEDGYGESPEAVAATIRLAIEAGLAGGNIEDKLPRADGLYDEGLAVDRIRAAREAIDASGNAFVLTARSDVPLGESKEAMRTAIRRLNLYREAGADCLYAPAATDLETVKTLVREAGGPINVVMGLANAQGNAHAYLAAGVRRISLGGSIARTALGVVRKAAQEVRDRGTVEYSAIQIPQRELNQLFSRARWPCR